MKNPLQLVRRTLPFSSWVSLLILGSYAVVAAFAFVQVVNPSLKGESTQHIAADSATYIYMADVLREHREDPWVYESLSGFPNTLWMPVAIAFVLNSTALTVLFNAVLFLIAVYLCRRIVPLNTIEFCTLLALNATTAISLLSVNKEVVDFFVLALFYFALIRRRRIMLLTALVLAFFNRYEVFVAFLIFIGAISRWNPWRERRWRTLLLLLLGFSVLLPVSVSHSLSSRFQEAEGGGLVTLLDQMEMHFLFFAASLPKIAENLFGALINPTMFAHFGELDLANSWILVLNNIATVFVLFRLGMKHRLSRRSIELDWMYLMAITSIVMSIALVIQPRYFYLVYVILCFETARRKTATDAGPDPIAVREGLAHA